jgi:DNA modification methylase
MSKRMKLSDLIPDDKNNNRHTAYGMDLLEKSVNKVGIIESITVSNDDKIISGNARHEVIGKNFTKEALVIETDGTQPIIIKRTDIHSDTKEFYEASILANTTSKKNIDFDMDIIDTLAVEYDIDVVDLGVDIVNEEILEAEEDDFSGTPPKEPITFLGDLYEIGEHRLLCGDSTCSDTVAKLMNGNKADMVFTDPPWNVNYGAVKEGNAMGYKPRTIMNDSMSTDDFKDFMGSAFSMMALYSKKGCPTYVVMSAQEWGNLMLALHENGYHWSSTIIWNKSHLVMSRKDYHTKYEPIWYGWLDGAPRLCPVEDRKQSDVWDVDRPTKSELHPTTKPIALIDIALKNSSKIGNLIFELFTGSGSTMVASHQLKRKCYGMELDPKYCDVIVARMIKLDSTLPIKRNGVLLTNSEVLKFTDNTNEAK